MSNPSRREVLQTLLAAGAAGALFATGCAAAVGPSGNIAAGNVSSVPIGSLKAIGTSMVILGRDVAGIYAMTTICPHANCDMTTQGTIDPSGIICACHNSQFTANGAVTKGPAKSSLTHFAVTVSAAGDLTVHASSTVSAATRLAIV